MDDPGGNTGDNSGSDWGTAVESQVQRWREHMISSGSVNDAELDELESRFRGLIDELVGRGLSPDEAFVVALKRMAGDHEPTGDFVRLHGEQLLTDLMLPVPDGDSVHGGTRSGLLGLLRGDLAVALILALVGGLTFKAPELFGRSLNDDDAFYLLNVSLLVLPFVAAYLGWRRRLAPRTIWMLVAVFVAAAVFANAYPYDSNEYPLATIRDTTGLIALHLPVLLWLAVGVAHTGGQWQSHHRRLDFVRFTGEAIVYYTLLSLGGAVLTALTVGAFWAIGVDTETFVGEWLVPCGAVGAAVITAWLVEARHRVVESIAPLLTKVFTPLFTLLLMALAVGLAVTGNGFDAERDVLIFLDVLLLVVLGLVLFTLSSRLPDDAADFTDRLQTVMLAAAVVVDLFALVAVISRISDYGFSANRTAGLGLNLLLLVNLAWATRLGFDFVKGRRTMADLQRWQTAYLPVWGAWCVAVVVAFGPIFNFA